MRRCPIAPLVAALVVAAAPASAQLTAFTSRAAFEAAAGPLLTQPFSAPFELVPTTGATYAFPGATLTLDANHGGMTYGGGDVLVDLHPAGMGEPGFLRFTFGAPVRAFGADFLLFDDPAIVLRAVVNGVTLDVGEGFFGVVSTVPFTTVDVRDPSDFTFVVVDDASFSVSAVPEPGTVSLLLVGLAAGAAVARRRATLRLPHGTVARGGDHA